MRREHDVLFDEMYRCAEIVDRDPIAKIAVKTVGLFDEDGTTLRVALEVRQHIAEAGPAAPFGRFDIGELAAHDDFAIQTRKRPLQKCSRRRSMLFESFDQLSWFV